jgi:hypothetical protein
MGMTPASDNWFAIYMITPDTVVYRRVAAWGTTVALLAAADSPLLMTSDEIPGLIGYRQITNSGLLRTIETFEADATQQAIIDHGGILKKDYRR